MPVAATAQGEALVDGAALALFDLVDRRLHVAVNAAPGDAGHGRKRAGVRVEQHLVALAGPGACRACDAPSPTGS